MLGERLGWCRLEVVIGVTKIRIIKGDITDQCTDALVNAANPSLMGGGGVDGAIHAKGGPNIRDECRKIRETRWPSGLPTGKAVITMGGDLKVQFVIHTVGPIWQGGKKGEPALLQAAYQNSLKLALSEGISTIAFPSISTGAYGYPIGEASWIALNTVKDMLESDGRLKEIVFVLFSQVDYSVYRKTAETIF